MKTSVANIPLADLLDQYTIQASPELCQVAGDRLRCLACGHRCLIGEGLRGTCKVRFNQTGQLLVPFGYVAGLQSDPVEKKPFFHVYPGSDALTFGMMGCDLHCSYCQNWVTSQALRDPQSVAPVRPVTPSQLIDVARNEGSRLVVSSYNEPLITAEWAVSVFREAKQAGLACAFVSNGNATPEVLDYLRPWIIAYKIDLKSFNDHQYRTLGGTLENITSTIRMVHERGIWLEIVTLIIPGFNDSLDELKQSADFIASVSPDIPWHVTAFHKDYRMTDPDRTSPETLFRAAELGVQAGLRYVYAGNLPGQVGPWENTRCPSCQATLIERYGYLIRGYHLTPDGRCPHCQTQLPGVWPGSPESVKTGNDMNAYRNRLPRLVPLETQLLSPSASSKGTAPMTNPTAASSELTADMKEKLFAATRTLLYNAIQGQTASVGGIRPELHDRLVSGAFVSLKRGKHLRSCCGVLGDAMPLHQAVERAATRTLWEDERFPPISPGELQELNLEVWLLQPQVLVSARGAARAQVITLGKHGIKVIRGAQSGLFLPSVAIENQWDAVKFLDQVCLKAGLPASAWREDDTALFTFEGEVMRGSLANTGPALVSPAGICQPEDVARLAEMCRGNVYALMRGAVPSYFWGAPDGMVNGLFLLIQQPSSGKTLQFSRLSLRPMMALQSHLFTLVQTASQNLANMRFPVEGLSELAFGLMILHDPVLHGTVADPHLNDFDPKRRALLVMERNKSALLYDPSRMPNDLLTEAVLDAQIHKPQAAPIYSLAATSNLGVAKVVTVPVPVRGAAIRPPAVAGQFYDGDPEALKATVDRFLTGARKPEPWSAAMVPHAGLVYSGRLAAEVLKRIQFPKTIIVIGPKHTALGVEWAVAPHQTWAMPGFEVASDFMWARRLSQAIPGLALDAAAHQQEHAIEIELPLLARLAPNSRVVGIAIGQAELEDCLRFAKGLAELIRERQERPLLLISSDMNHYATDAETRRLDALAIACLQQRDPIALYNTVTQHNISMCGVLPAVIVLETLRLLGTLNRAEQVGYATSAEVSGDTSRVVGYSGMLFA